MEPIDKLSIHQGLAAANIADKVNEMIERMNYLQDLVEGHIYRFNEHTHLVDDREFAGETTKPKQ